MADLNVLDFYKDTAKILIQLHQSFPRKIEIYVEDLIGADHVDDFGLHSKRHESCFGALLWLSEEGYLRFQSTVRQEAIDQAVLTSKSIVLLGSINRKPVNATTTQLPPFEANEQHTMIEQLRRAISSHSSEQLAVVMRSFYSNTLN